jgi:hypothetical protein
VAAFSSFIILPSAFEMSLVTSAATKEDVFERVAGECYFIVQPALNPATWAFHPRNEPVTASSAPCE